MSNILEQGMIKSGLLNIVNAGTAPVDDMASFFEKELSDMTSDMDLPFSSSDLMSSEFFDSVLSMERENGLDSVLDGYDYDLNLSDGGTISNNDSHSALSPSTSSSDSDDRFNVVQDLQENNSITLFGNDISSEISNQTASTDLSAYYSEQETSPISTYTSPSSHKNKFIMRRQNRVQNNYNNNNKNKIIVANPVSNNKTTMKNNQVIRVQSISGNGRSLLLPVNVKKIKIVSANNLKMENIKVIQNSVPAPSIVRKVHIDKYASSSAESVDDDMELDSPCNTYSTSNIPAGKGERSYPPLELTSEERRLLYKEGIQLPTHYPLTKNEEKELKRIRRKIRNKISAQDSRKRKKEYVDKLEEQAKRTCEENEFLKKRIKLLRKQNTKLMDQMRRLQEVLFRSSGTKATPTTCLMIVLFSTLLVCLPNMRSTIDQQQQQQQSSLEATANQKNLQLDSAPAQTSTPRRALLFDQKGDANEDIVSSIQDLLILNKNKAHAQKSTDADTLNENDTHHHNKQTFLVPDDTDGASEEFLAKCFDRDGNMRQNISGILGDFCKRYEGDILVLLKNMLQSQQQGDSDILFADDECEEDEEDCDGDSGYGVLDKRDIESFIEPDISDDDGDVDAVGMNIVEQMIDFDISSQPSLKRRRTTTLDSAVNQIHAK